LQVTFLGLGGFDYGLRRRAPFLLPGAPSSRLHLVAAAGRHLFSLLPVPAATTGDLVPVLGSWVVRTVGWRRRRERGVYAGPLADCRRLSAHRTHGARQLMRALAIQRAHETDNKSVVLLAAHHQISAAVTSCLSVRLRLPRHSLIRLI